MESSEIPTFLIKTDTPIAFHELPLLRGAVINMPSVKDLLYHNHLGGGYFRYSYPLVQYKRLDGKAALLFVGEEGTDAVAELLREMPESIRLGDRTAEFKFSGVEAKKTRVQVWDDFFSYTVRKCLPFNQDNYKLYIEADSLADKLSMVERNLVGNILSFAKGMGIHFEKRVEVKLSDISEPHAYDYKGVKMTGFDLLVKANVSLPDHIGLGKGVSLGFGMVKRQQ